MSASQRQPWPALGKLLQAVEQVTATAGSDANAVLPPYISAALKGHSDAADLSKVLQTYGWDGSRFNQGVCLRSLSNRLKALTIQDMEQIGQGAYAVVYRAFHRTTGETITLKRLKLDEEEDGVPCSAIREVSLLKELNHPNVVQLRDVLWDISRMYLVMECLDVDLRQHLDQQGSLDMPTVKSFMYQILQGIRFSHTKRIIHRDLKPQNILVDQATQTIKVADFGLARCVASVTGAYTHEVVTLLYRAPEILLGATTYSTPIDIWSIGCIFAELVNGVPLFLGDSEIGQLYKIFQVLGTPDVSLWNEVDQLPYWQMEFPQWPRLNLQEAVPRLDPLGVDLLQQMLRYQPSERITAAQALLHPYFNELRFSENSQGSSQTTSGYKFSSTSGTHPATTLAGQKRKQR